MSDNTHANTCTELVCATCGATFNPNETGLARWCSLQCFSAATDLWEDKDTNKTTSEPELDDTENYATFLLKATAIFVVCAILCYFSYVGAAVVSILACGAPVAVAKFVGLCVCSFTLFVTWKGLSSFLV